MLNAAVQQRLARSLSPAAFYICALRMERAFDEFPDGRFHDLSAYEASWRIPFKTEND
jgi:hypothetical protein